MRSFQTIPDSDQSISDEEESDQDWPNTCATLGGFAQKKEELPLLLRLEMLKGGNVYADKLEDEVSSDDEGNNVLAKRSDTAGAKMLQRNDVCKEEGSNTWFAASKEAEALFRLNEKASCSSVQSSHLKVNKSSKGVKGTGKPKFAFRFQTHKEGQSCSSVLKDENDMPFKFQEMPERLDAIEPRTTEHMDAELLEDIQGEEETQLEIVPIEVYDVGHGTTEQSMADLLDGLQDKTTTPRYSRKRHKRAHAVVKIVSPLGDRLMESESSPEHVGLGSTSGSDENDQTLKLDKPEVKRQTLVDLFQDALTDRALIPLPKPLRIGLFGQLQQVLLSEKETDMEFLKNIEQGDDQNDTSCIDVKIVSKCLDAKLTVCCCSFGNLKSLPWPESPKNTVNDESPKNTVNDETTWTVIFNPRVCNDVDLDVGKWIRIHPPWKEIHECNDKGVILSTYFSEILI